MIRHRLAEIIEDPSTGRLSSRRAAALLAVVTLAAGFLGQVAAAVVIAWRNPELPHVPLDATITMTLGAIALGGLGLSTAQQITADKQATARATTAMRAIPEDRP